MAMDATATTDEFQARDTRALKELDRPTPADAPAAQPAPAAGNGNGAAGGSPALVHPRIRPLRQRDSDRPKTWVDRIEAFISRLSVRDNFWHSVCALIWLPLAFFSGIRMKLVKGGTAAATAAILPFRRFNQNWYRAMAGGALLANSEIAGGMYVFGIVGGDYTVVCKHLSYKFLRPCFGPAVYRMHPRENIEELVKAGTEFNTTLDLHVYQQASRIGERDKRVGECVVTFHVTPKAQHKTKKARRTGK